jgi:hypothetical protein
VSWRAIFFLSLPLVAAAMAIGIWAIDESRNEQIAVRQIDLAGAALAALGLGGLSFALVQGPALGWGDATVLLAAAIGVVALAGFVLQERRATSPMLPLQLFRSRDLSAANGATLALYAIFNGNFFILTIYLQTTLRLLAVGGRLGDATGHPADAHAGIEARSRRRTHRAAGPDDGGDPPYGGRNRSARIPAAR